MPSLSALQTDMFDALLGRAAPDASLFAATPAGYDAALAVHRGTIFGGAANALRLCFPTVDKLVGTGFFDRVCADYLRTTPPQSADLIAFAPGFVEFLATYEPARTLDYLTDVARLDLSLDRAARSPCEVWRCFAIDTNTTLKLHASTQVLQLTYAADDIRDAVERGDESALTSIDLTPARRWLIIWRRGTDLSARQVSAPAGLFLKALLETNDFARAVEAATGASDGATTAAAIQSEIFATPFSNLCLSESEQ